jgi:hypothetical protein
MSTRSIFGRYDIVNEKDISDAAQKIEAFQIAAQKQVEEAKKEAEEICSQNVHRKWCKW